MNLPDKRAAHSKNVARRDGKVKPRKRGNYRSNARKIRK
jgi:hypothetical protein